MLTEKGDEKNTHVRGINMTISTLESRENGHLLLICILEGAESDRGDSSPCVQGVGLAFVGAESGCGLLG
jgi:hypothetical protein